MEKVFEKTEIKIWKEHPIYKGIFVSPDGWVWNRRDVGKKKGKPTIGADNGHGYLQVGFRENGKLIYRKVHRLIAETFIPIPDHLKHLPNLEVNHKDENKQNNAVENLEWMKHKDNLNYGTRNERAAKALSNHPSLSMPIVGVNKSTSEVVEFPSAKEAERQLGIAQQNIIACLKGRKKSAGGYYWYYKEDYYKKKNERA